MAVWAGLLILCSGAAVAQSAGSTAQNPAPGATASTSQRTDGQIEMDVVKALDASTTLKDDLITAATIQGEITLSGTVSSQASKDLAGSIAAQVPGVTKVHNNLVIGNPQQAAAAENLPGVQDDNPADSQGPEQPQQAPPQYQPMPAPENGQAQAGQAPPPSAEPGPYGEPYPSTRPQYSPYPPAQPQYGNPQYGYGNPQNSYRQPQNSQPPRYQQASGPLTVPEGALIQARTSEPVDSKHASAGTPVQFTLIQDVTVGGYLAIPRGATLHGVVTDATQAGKLAGSSELALTLTSFDLGGLNYPIHSDEFRVKSPNKAGRTVSNAVAGGLLGTIIGCVAGRGVGCAIGAGAGAAAGTAASAATPGPNVWIPSEALVAFHLAAPVTVNPVTQQEADRLAQGLYNGGP
ncbi:MAG: BON domain-containing protein, partial [Acidobacteriota bacterium]